MFKDIKEFHKKFELEALEKPGFLDDELTQFRIKFMQEELNEFHQAFDELNLHDAFDALIDLTYVVLGTAYLMGLPFKKGWSLVHEANMQKVRATKKEQSKRSSTSDVIKPAGWVAPNLDKLIYPENYNYHCIAISYGINIACPYSNNPLTECIHAKNHTHLIECDTGCGSYKDLICSQVIEE